MLKDLGWLKQIKVQDSTGTVINPSTNEKLDELKALLQKIDENTDELEINSDNIEINTDNIDLNTDELETKIDQTNIRLGEVQSSPTQYTVLGRLKDLWDKLVELFNDGLAKIKIWDGSNIALITSEGRLQVDTLSGYKTKSSMVVTDIQIPIDTYYTLVNLTSKVGISEEIHIVCETVNFRVRIEVDGEVLCNNLRFGDLEDRFNLISAKGITTTYHQTYSRKDFHCNLPIYFNNSFKIQIINNNENNKKLFGSSIVWRESI